MPTKKIRGWGSVPVVVTIGTTTWKTSVFPYNPHKKEGGGAYLLPLKASVRTQEDVYIDKVVRVTLVLQTGTPPTSTKARG